MIDDPKKLATTATPGAPAPAAVFLVPTNAKLLRQVASAAGWLWAFAALSVVNLILVHVKAPFAMVMSLFVSDFLFAVGRELGTLFVGAALIFDALIIGFVTFLGFQVKKWRVWALVTAMTVLAIDAVLLYFLTTLAGVWPFILHLFALYFLFAALKPAKLLNQRKANGQA